MKTKRPSVPNHEKTSGIGAGLRRGGFISVLHAAFKASLLGLLLAAAGCISAGPPPRSAARVESVEEIYARLLSDSGRSADAPEHEPDDELPIDERYRRLLREVDGQKRPALPPPDESAVPAVPDVPRAPAVVPSGVLTIQPEALLRIRIVEDPSLNGQYTVNDIGAINLGYIGPVILFNRTEGQAAERIRQILMNRDFRNATVTVETLRASYDRVSVVGEVNRPGFVRIGAGEVAHLNELLLRAGGLRGSVRGMQVRVLRGGVTNVLAVAQKGEMYAMQDQDGRPAVPDVWLSNNDKVIIASSQTQAAPSVYGDKEILVLGEVNRRGPIRFSSNEPCTMLRLVFKMGGFPQYANRRAVRILRRDELGIEREIVVNVEEIMETGDPDLDVHLEHGDRVIVPARRISLF